jgi:para-nitrobenzyl esterase
MKWTLLLLGVLAVTASLQAHGDDLTLKTAQGTLIGETVGDRADVAVFKGIPYAVPPTGQRRWTPPEPAPNWPGVRIAKAFSPICMQQEEGDYHIPLELQSEDCLYLNVWTSSQPDAQAKRPVLLYIHGGGMMFGSAAEKRFNAAQLVRKGVTVVTINYRLNVFSFFAHPELTAESPHHSSGNYGLLDAVQALKWVQANIAAYGGDPNNVTLAGESGGGRVASLLLATPLTQGLFERAILQYTNPFGPMHELSKPYQGAPSAETLGVRFAERVGAPSLAALRAMSPQALQERTHAVGDPGMLAIVDGWMFPQQTYDLYLQNKQRDVPVLLGFSANESSSHGAFGLIGKIPADAPRYEAEVRKRYGDLARDYLAVYPSSTFEDSAYAAVSDGMTTWPVVSFARLAAQHSSPAYLYYMAHIPPKGRLQAPGTNRKLGAYHAADLGYFFNNYNHPTPTQVLIGAEGGITEQDRELATMMSDYYVAFIKTGVPKVDGLPQWKPYSLTDKDYMKFVDGKPVASRNLLPGHWEIWEKINARRQRNEIFWRYESGMNGFSERQFAKRGDDES